MPDLDGVLADVLAGDERLFKGDERLGAALVEMLRAFATAGTAHGLDAELLVNQVLQFLQRTHRALVRWRAGHDVGV